MKHMVGGLILWLVATSLTSSCAPAAPVVPTVEPSPTPDIPVLNERQVISLVADRFKDPSVARSFSMHAGASYQGTGRWLVVYGTPQWEIFERDKSVFPMNPQARSQESATPLFKLPGR